MSRTERKDPLDKAPRNNKFLKNSANQTENPVFSIFSLFFHREQGGKVHEIFGPEKPENRPVQGPPGPRFPGSKKPVFSQNPGSRRNPVFSHFFAFFPDFGAGQVPDPGPDHLWTTPSWPPCWRPAGGQKMPKNAIFRILGPNLGQTAKSGQFWQNRSKIRFFDEIPGFWDLRVPLQDRPRTASDPGSRLRTGSGPPQIRARSRPLDQARASFGHHRPGICWLV